MAATRINPQEPGSSGAAVQWTAADTVNGNDYSPAQGRVLIFRNAGAGAADVTIVTPGTVDGNPVADRVISVPNGSVPFVVSLNEAKAYRTPMTGVVTFTAAAAMDVAVVQA